MIWITAGVIMIANKTGIGHRDALQANSRRSSARPQPELFRASREQFARSSHNSALTNVPTISVMQAMLQYDGSPLQTTVGEMAIGQEVEWLQLESGTYQTCTVSMQRRRSVKGHNHDDPFASLCQ
jgi:hypothetical protein